ncbi:DUF4158 domain-containing protein [Brevibacillus laterosporus]|uniref:DUF4158 domain-containing protein n=1 Tax=Brevibacillus laterosporus TaxID=1465 RepID=UPI002E201B7C
MLKYFQQEARFPTKKQDIPKVIVDFVAYQLDMVSDLFEEYRWGAEERNFTYHRKQIREFFGFSELSAKEIDTFKEWLKEQVQFTHDVEYLKNQAYSLFRTWKVEPPEWKYITRKLNADIVCLDNETLFDSRKFKTMGDLGKLLEDQFLSMLAYVAEQERKKNRQRQAEGIEVARADGVTFGRPKQKIDATFILAYQEWRDGRIKATEAMRRCGLTKPTFYRRVQEYESGERA